MRTPVILLCVFSLISGACDPGETVVIIGGDTSSSVRICASGSTQACLCAGRAAGAQVCNETGTSWLPCECGGGPADGSAGDGSDAAVEDAGDLSLDLGPLPDVAPAKLNLSLYDPDRKVVSSLSAVHSVGVSPCPQRLGTFVALNGTAFPATLGLSLGKAASIAFTPVASIDVAVGATVQIDVEFKCGSTEPINTSVEVAFGNASGDADASFPLALAFEGGDGDACQNPSDQSALSAGPDPEGVADTEGLNCFLSGHTEDGPFAQCVAAALQANTALSVGCVYCYASAELCAKNNCLTQCLAASEICGACRESAGCTAAFYDCSGLQASP
jgi:hypothetical protein